MAPRKTKLTVTVVYAERDHATAYEVEVPVGSTAFNVLERSLIFDAIEPATRSSIRFGVFGRECGRDYLVADGDQIEVYRPLTIDPKERRRLQARRVRAD